MARATDTDVRAYVEMLDATSTTPYITAAAAVVEANLASSGLSETILTQIEIFLAAHFAVLAVEKGGLRRETAGDSGNAYQTISERFKGFHLTRFGQTAISIDTTGKLAAIGNSNLKALFSVIGSADVDNAS